MIYNGLLPDTQPEEVFLPLTRWKYGEIRNDRKVVDPILQYGCYVLGYNNQEITDFVHSVLTENKPEIGEHFMPKTNTLRLNQIYFDFTQKVKNISGMDCFFALSGSDANEGAVKLASAYHAQKGNFHKTHIAGFKDSYHGSTFMTMSLGCENFMDEPFYTLNPHQDVKKIPRDFEIDDINWHTIAAVIVETCAYGPNMTPPSQEFWNKLDKIRNDYDVLVIIDDIFMGGGKTGNYIGWSEFNFAPDISTMGKAITGGIFPLSMTLYNDKVKNTLPKEFFWEHGFTYSFSLPGVASAYKYLEILERDNLLANHNQIVDRARRIFEDAGFRIKYQFGVHFKIANDNQKHFYIIPINADDEYFAALEENLRWFTQNTTH